MKKIFSLLFALMATIGTQAQTWDFSRLSSADFSAINSDNTNWYLDTDKNRYSYQKALNDEELAAAGTVFGFTEGLFFTAPAIAEGKTQADGVVRLDVKNSNLNLNGTVTVKIKNQKAGNVITITAKSSSSSTARTINIVSNITNTENFGNTSTDQQTYKGTVTADGDIVFQSGGGTYVYSIKVEDPSGTGPATQDDVINNAVSMNLNKNQARLTLTNSDIKYYNTEDLKSIDIDNETNQVNVVPSSGSEDIYYGTVKTLAFSKKMDQGASGDITNNGVEITEAKGWQESAYVKWTLPSGLGENDSYNVYIKGGQYASDTKLDEQLVRSYGTYGRADAVGLMAGNYTMTVVPVVNGTEQTSQASQATNLEVVNYDRSGFAHSNASGIGAYNDDGTLKAGAIVLYVTKNNFNTITASLKTDNKGNTKTYTGLGNILEGKQKGYDNTPIAVRFIGEIKTSDVASDQLKSDEDGLQLKGNSNTTEMNVTLEGIGDDATFNGFGMTFYNGTKVEMRNIGLVNFNDDGIQLKGTANAWIHNNDFFYGSAGGDADQAKGDGSLDVKDDSQYCTFSYNHFWDSGKTSLCGMKSESGPNWLTYHHNWFDHSDSRHPRVRKMSVHVYNNYYDGVSKIGVGAVAGANIFVEANYFRNSKNPMLISEQGTDGRNGFADDHDGGMIKAYSNILTGKSLSTFIPHTKSATEFDAYVAESRDEQVPSSYKSVVGNYTYSNWDTDSGIMYTYTPDEPSDIPALVTGWLGAGRMNHGDLQWTFTEADDTKDAIDSALKSAVTGYKTKLVGIFGDENASSGEQGGDDTGGGNTGDTTISAAQECYFTGSAPSNTLFTISGNYSNSKGSATVNGTTYDTCLKMETATSIKFTLEKAMTLYLVFGPSETGKKVKVDDTTYTTDSSATVTVGLAAGSHEIKKGDSINLFYIGLSE